MKERMISERYDIFLKIIVFNFYVNEWLPRYLLALFIWVECC